MFTARNPARRRRSGRGPAHYRIRRDARYRHLAIEILEIRRLLAVVSSLSTNSAAQGTANLTVTITLSGTPPAPPTGVGITSVTIGTLPAESQPAAVPKRGHQCIHYSRQSNGRLVHCFFNLCRQPQFFLVWIQRCKAAPAIQVLDGATAIANGGSDAFGSTVLGTPVSKTFTVKNGGRPTSPRHRHHGARRLFGHLQFRLDYARLRSFDHLHRGR